METRVSLCQYQTRPSSSFSPYHTTSTPSGASQTVTVCTSVPVISLASVAFPEPHPLDGSSSRPRVRSQF